MIAAVYCRKSTEQAVADDAKSVTRQIEHAREYATRKDWTVADEHIYVDDGISGAEFANRPGFVRLMNALKPKPHFDVLIMSEDSRLGREAIETAYALKLIIQSGVRVFCYLEDRERTLDSPIEKVMLSLQAMADEMEREKARQRMVDTMTRKARAGHVTGGACFGYDNEVVVAGNGARSHVEYRINESQATVIRRIFELAAEGYGQRAIAKLLNSEGVPAPRAQQGRPRAWGPSSVHEALHRDRYRGVLVWNKTKKRDRWGRVRVSGRDRSEWLTTEAPHLRIVPEDLWQAAHRQIEHQRRFTNIWRSGPVASRYLLPGLAKCACCNGGMHVRVRTRSNGNVSRFYACTSHYNRGPSVCQNAVQMDMGAIDAAVINRIGDILTPTLVEIVIEGVREAMTPNARAGQREKLEAAVAGFDLEVQNLADAIARGGNIPALVERLQTAERGRQDALQALNATEHARDIIRVDWRAMERQARRLLADWRGLLARHGGDARPVLAELLEGPIMFTPIVDGDRRGYRFNGSIGVGEILAETVKVSRVGVPGQN
jgi:site-specific DNA recombinase